MAERSAAESLGRIHELESALLASMRAIHRDGGCGNDGGHTAQCTALFEKLGWGSYEEFKTAMEAMGPSSVTARVFRPQC
jgi:hypothetical protein